MDTITIKRGNDGPAVELNDNAFDEFLGIVYKECGQKLEAGTSEVAHVWQELRTLSPQYAGGGN